MQVSMFRAGIPCPSTLTADGGLFCGGVGLCDFNTGNERILAEGGQMGDAGRFEAPVPDEVPKIEMRKVGDARVSLLHYGDDAAEGV